MFKKLFTISLVLVLSGTFIFAQSINSEIPQKNRATQFSKGELGEKDYGNDRLSKAQYHPSQEPVVFSQVAGLIDTFSVRQESYDLGEEAGYWDNGQDGFGMNAQDEMTIWYEAPADLYVKAVGFACSDNLLGLSVSVKITKVLYPASEMNTGATYLGYYPEVGDGFREITPFPYDATGDWVEQGGHTEIFADPDYWSDAGFGWEVTPVVTSSSEPVYQWVEMSGLGYEADVKRGEIFGVTVVHNGEDVGGDVDDRIGFWSGDMSISGNYARNIKHYEDGRNTNGPTPPADGGVWLRNYALDFVAIVDIYGDAAPTITDVTQLITTLSTDSRTVEATITDTNPGDPGGSVGVDYAKIVYTVDGGAEMTVDMTNNGDLYSGDIPGQPAGSEVTYWVVAADVNGTLGTSPTATYNVFKPDQTNALLVFNGWEGISGYPQSYYFGSGDYPNGYSTLEWSHDVWAYGALTEELVNAYDNIIEIATNGPAKSNIAVIRAWLEGASGRNYMLAGDEWLGAHTGWSDSTYVDGDFQKDILGIAADHNDINYAATGDQGLASMVQAVEGSELGGALFTLHAQVSSDSGWTSSIAYDPVYEVSVSNWLDGADFVDDVEVDIRATGIDGSTYDIGGHRTLANGNKVVFFGFDPLSLNSHDTSGGQYWWYGFTLESPQNEALAWFGANIVGVEEDKTMPKAYKLSQNYPNPFNPTTVISYAIPEKADVTLKIFNLLGQEVAVLANGVKTAGNHEVNFNAGHLSSGVYFYSIKAGSFTSTKKMMLIK